MEICKWKTERNNFQRISHHFLIFSFLFIFSILSCSAQSIYFSRYIGLNYLSDPVYQLDIFNPTDQAKSLANYMLVSRQFVAKLPPGTQIDAFSKLSIGKENKNEIDLPFSRINDFIIRIPKEKQLGDYLVLIDPQSKIVDAFYYGPNPEVSFLPDEGELITFRNESIPFNIPDELSSSWRYLQIAPDPALAFIRVNGQWEVSSRKRNTLPATAFGILEAKYVQGIVTINGQSRFERDCLPHQLERSEDGRNFEMIYRFPAVQNADELSDYRYYDKQVKTDHKYFYRLKNEDKFGYTVFSNLVEVLTDELPSDFFMEVFQSKPINQLNVRFSTRQARHVRIKILDEQFRELDLLFYDELTENSQHLIKYDADLPPGKYLILADMGERRVYETIIISR